MSDELERSIGSGNVFEDLELPESDELLAKAKLASQIGSIVRHRRLTQAEAARILGVSQPRVSDLMRGRLGKFSLDKLVVHLVALGRDVEIVVRPGPGSPGRGRLSVDAA